jgi:hypothetical protein
MNVKCLNFRIMKARNLLRILFTAIAVFAFSAAFAQNVPYAEMTQSSALGETDSVTVNTKMMYYVEPDPILNNLSAAYDTTATRGAQGVNSTFGFSWNAGGVGTILTPTVDADAPFRMVRFQGTPGTGTLEVVETSSGAGCADATPTTQDIEVIAAPVLTIGGPGIDEICHSVGAAGYGITVSTITVAPEGGFAHVMGDITVDTDTDADGTFETNIAARTKNDTIFKLHDPVGAGEPSTTLATVYMGTQGGNITRYRFDFGATVDATDNNGINDYISRKSDYFENALGAAPADTDFQFYAATDAADADKIIDIVVYPTPSTQDIYFIPNDFNQ